MVGVDLDSWGGPLPYFHSLFLRLDPQPASPRGRDHDRDRDRDRVIVTGKVEVNVNVNDPIASHRPELKSVY